MPEDTDDTDIETYRFTEVTRSERGITISYYDDDGAVAVCEREVFLSFETLQAADHGYTFFSSAEADRNIEKEREDRTDGA